ncbi:MAG: DNA polymerase III subunit delta [Clostridiales bacterium]|nr:DNA polymerase III subunit delta [Clostridiales bacterium]
MKNIEKDIKTNSFKPLYLIYGEEGRQRDGLANRIKNTLLSQGAQESVYEGAFDPYDLINDANTLSLFGGLRIITVKDSDAFSGAKFEKLIDYFKDPNPDCVIVFNEKKIDKRSRVYKAFAKTGYAAECKKPTAKELRAFVLSLSKQNNLPFEGAALESFLSNLDESFGCAENEFNKLAAYTLGRSRITLSDVEAVTTKKLENRIFDLIDAAVGKQPKKALDILSNLILQKESNIAVLVALSRQFRLILQYKFLSKTTPQSEMAKKLGVHPYVASKTAAQSRNFTNKQLLAALSDCKNMLKESFSGNMDLTCGIEILILKYSA